MYRCMFQTRVGRLAEGELRGDRCTGVCFRRESDGRLRVSYEVIGVPVCVSDVSRTAG